jgi:formate dehydrogenase subunit delta
MHIDYLIRMANDIGAFFTGADAEDVAATNIRAHIKRFWDPRMRAQIVAHYNETKGAELQGAVRTAIAQLAEEAAKKPS